MTQISRAAENCLVATCAHLSLTTVQGNNFDLWISIIREVLPYCEGCSAAVVPLRASASDLVCATSAMAQRNALSRLKHEAARYYALAAANRYESWKHSKAELAEVVE